MSKCKIVRKINSEANQRHTFSDKKAKQGYSLYFTKMIYFNCRSKTNNIIRLSLEATDVTEVSCCSATTSKLISLWT